MTPTQDADCVLSVRDLSKTYGDDGDAVAAVDGVSFDIYRGEVVGLLGPNGAGKTTTIKSILGLVAPTSGHVDVLGDDPIDDPRRVHDNATAVLEGARNVYWRLTVRENLRFFTGLAGDHPNERTADHDRLLDVLGLEAKADTVVNELSRGQKQKVSLACALVRDAPLVFLDEPTLGLDVAATRDLRTELTRLADEEDRTFVVSSHDMDTVRETCDRVVVLNGGRVVAEDSVSEFVDLFQTQTYRVDLADRPPSPIEGFDVVWTGETTVEAAVTGTGEFYEFVDALRDAGAVVESIAPADDELEGAFLSAVGGEAA
jgi:ABC-2 type transport system ATP-binding protein